MGKIKKEQIKDDGRKQYSLEPLELVFIKAIRQASVEAATNYHNILRTYLTSIAGGRLGYGNGTDLKFEIDIDQETPELFITEIKS